MDFTLYVQKQRQLERRKKQLANNTAIETASAAIAPPVISQNTVTHEQAKHGGLYGEYPDLAVLVQAIELANAKRERAKKGLSRDTENELCLRKFKPVIETWILAKVILDRKFFALVIYFAIGCADYPLLIAMCDLSIELGIVDFEPTLRRELQGFIVDELYEVYKKSYLLQPDGTRTFKRLRQPFPEWFWQIFERVVTEKTWATVWHKQSWLLNLAGMDAARKGKHQQALRYWDQSKALRLENNATGGNGFEQEYNKAFELMTSTTEGR